MRRVVVVGASLAGMRAAESLRSEGFAGELAVVGAEGHLPYDRPPLSKQFLQGTWDRARIALRSEERLGALGLDLRLGAVAADLDPVGHLVHLSDGDELAYDGLVVATGAAPRTLPGSEGLTWVHVLRTLDDAESLRSAFAQGAQRMVVVGAGFIGSEVASSCRAMGMDVTVVEALEVPLSGVLGEQMGRVCADLHQENGVELVTGVGVVGFEEPEVGSRRIRLSDGRLLPADVAVVGIGVTPATSWLEGSGLEVANGVHCDGRLFAAPDVVVAGDVANWLDEATGDRVRIEHWTNAAEQGVLAGRNLLSGSSDAAPYDAVPYFWSDVYGSKIQVLGRPGPDDQVVVVHGSTGEKRFVALYERRGRLSGVLGFSSPRQVMSMRAQLVSQARFDEALAAFT